jgi:hypothetical protein
MWDTAASIIPGRERDGGHLRLRSVPRFGAFSASAAGSNLTQAYDMLQGKQLNGLTETRPQIEHADVNKRMQLTGASLLWIVGLCPVEQLPQLMRGPLGNNIQTSR